ncbi:hypothetical protein [Paenibacillus sp. V4I5]|uniref:hypothetical protein n=1 Tax=Paenibacillus sp. V4I5 TaxID=3042306 RepID=UPI00279367E6|nr:hypothetical protein [Paenibacillus sp. V4I5]MDQ0914661.1 putative transposase [Paenibacillus sp. V4I5]
MPRRKLIEHEVVDAQYLNYGLWPEVDVNALHDTDQDTYLRRKQAVEEYLKGILSEKQIVAQTRISRNELRRLVRRCLSFDADGYLWGFRALRPQKNVRIYKKKKSEKGFHEHKRTGEFELLLDRYPTIRNLIHDLYLKRRSKSPTEPVIKPVHLFSKFTEACRKEGIKLDEYPFNTESQGYRSLQRYLKKIELKHFGIASSRYGEDAHKKSNNTGISEQNEPNIVRPYQRVQFDAHRIDAVFSISFTTVDGDEVNRILERIWILSLIDVGTRTVLSHYISLNKEISAVDVMTCIRKAVMPHKTVDFTIPGLKIIDDGGFPSDKLKDCEWAVWEELSFDNGKANLANMVRDKLKHLIGCSVNAGPVSLPMRRPYIERFFQTLEEYGFHRLPSTTGSNPKDPRRNNPEKKAIQYHITLENLEELAEVLIANYNGTPHGGISHLTPLEAMEQRLGRGMLPTNLEENKRSDVAFMQIEIFREVRGNLKTGKRPHINFANEEYRNDILANSGQLIGSKLNIHVNVDDIRFLRAFLPDGTEFGILTVAGKWSEMPHSLKLRQQIHRLKEKKVIHYSKYDDPISVYQIYMTNMALQKDKSSVNRLAQIRRLQQQKAEEAQAATTLDLLFENTSDLSMVDINDDEDLQHHTIIF